MSALLALLLAAQPPTIVAHRALGKGVPENTLAALRQAIDRGTAIVELDVRITRDGHLVIIHDETLGRTTDCSGAVASAALAAIRACDAGWPSHAGERVPTLAEALDTVRTTPVRLLLDIKPGTSLDAVIRAVRDHRSETMAMLGLRRASDIARARRELPGTSIIGFIPDVGEAQAFTEAGAHIIRLWSDWVDAEPGLVARTRALGPEVWIMVGRRLPSKKREWRALHARMVAAGPQGLITDRPDLISAK